MAKTHYKKLFNPDYLGSWDFEGIPEITLTIASVKEELITSPNGETSHRPVIRWKEEGIKPMVLNKKNSKTITKFIAGSPYVDDWVGLKVKLHAPKEKVFGEWDQVVRIKAEKVQKQKKPFTREHPKFDKTLEQIRSGNYSVEALCKTFEVSEELVDFIKRETGGHNV